MVVLPLPVSPTSAVVVNASKTIQGASKLILSNTARLLASGMGGRVRKGEDILIKQLPDFKDWRLFSTTSPVRQERGLKRLDS